MLSHISTVIDALSARAFSRAARTEEKMLEGKSSSKARKRTALAPEIWPPKVTKSSG